MKIYFKVAFCILGLTLITACSTQVARVEADQAIDLSGAWNDTDSRIVAENIIQEFTQVKWLPTFQLDHGRKPVILIDQVSNLTHEHISTETFISDISRALVNSGRISLISSQNAREKVRQERLDQDVYTRSDMRKEVGQELGADFLLTGSISNIIDMEGRKQVTFYQVDLNLIDVETGEITWIGQSKIKKYTLKGAMR